MSHAKEGLDFPGGSDGKESVYNVGDPGLIPESGRSPGEEMATHSSTLAWKIPWTEEPGGPFHGVTKSRTQLSDFSFSFFLKEYVATEIIEWLGH